MNKSIDQEKLKRSIFRNPHGKVCTRRCTGMFGFAFVLFMVYLGSSDPILEPILWASCSLIGLTTVDVVKGMSTKNTVLSDKEE